ncbi:MAG: tRNA 4-thiouridine(8) synthase ThiI [Deltaproteobacteria bacterium]|nr:MAG: tRNA 4-thiouridine(8) synthase ThiI [Deltaproteobacteria bacterium]
MLENITALGISSGGLDSILAAFVMQSAGINVKWITFETPFFSSEKSVKASKLYNISLRVENITIDYTKMLKAPAGGYGKNMNPCLDCHSLMFRKAGELMEEEGASFLFSGEVLGQRPMSQTRNSLRYVEKQSGYEGLIVRPLSGRLLPETIPEANGWVKRDSFADISGRSRKRQFLLAKEFGIKDFPSAGGGCLLTEKVFSGRLNDLFEHQESIETVDYELLKYGRHLRISPFEKLVIGRDESENNAMERLAENLECIKIRIFDYPGPFAVLRGSGENMFTAGAICAGYTRAPVNSPCRVSFEKHGMELVKEIYPIEKSDIKDMFIK